jgi:hypothetical protein
MFGALIIRFFTLIIGTKTIFNKKLKNKMLKGGKSCIKAKINKKEAKRHL